MKEKNSSKKEQKNKKSKYITPVFWFIIGMFFASFCLATFFLIYFKVTYKNKVIPGIFLGNTYVGEKNANEVARIFEEKNKSIGKSTITFQGTDNRIATVSAQELGIGYDVKLMVSQAESIGKNKDIVSNIYYILNSYLNGTYLNPSYTSSLDNTTKLLSPIEKEIHISAQDALFEIKDKKVVAFKESINGRTIDFDAIEKSINQKIPEIISGKIKSVTLPIPLKILKPNIPTEKANNLGIVEEIGEGTSLFAHSIPGRIHNVALAAGKINGVLVPPGEEFSFVKNLGDVTQYTGYQQAYIIQNGKTVLGDGGGVCQVSTTLFRALLNAGLPITNRVAHAYRVGYYEQDSPPGLDATVYYPTVDLKFKNDTENYILIVAHTDLDNLRLTFNLYGKKDGREVSMSTPIVTSQTPAPETAYQDDPTLPRGQVKQVDFAADGATVIFSRKVTKNGKVVIADSYKSVYRPWQAVFLRGTKEG
ncbi:MAG: VanW family protein [Candidatus Levybacteria bacterium]|nr:VanW family protein [Candidatus Levybacteria bacterium]MBP9814915.1 VanW family protein [Candidatus Levybacteria bacterium]